MSVEQIKYFYVVVVICVLLKNGTGFFVVGFDLSLRAAFVFV